MGNIPDDITADEWASLSAAQRTLLMEVEAMPDLTDDEEGDNRYGDLPYDDVFGPDGELLT